MLTLPGIRKSVSLPGAIVGLILVIALIGMSIWTLVTLAAPQQPAAEPGNSPISPLLFGTNLTVDTEHDQWLTSPEARQSLKDMGITFVRMPMRESVPAEVELSAIRLIKEMGMTPLIILHQETRNENALAEDTEIIEGTNQIFGNEVVYYEYGNEPDCPCGGEEAVSIEDYTASWNKVVPELKKVATNAKFIGPVLMEYNEEKAAMFQHFIENANPEPDIVSWHAYTCALDEPEDACISDIDSWTEDFGDARLRMQTVLGKELPIMITEYNYTPHLQKGQHDGKDQSKDFMMRWTTKALEVLAQNKVFGANQYAATNTPIPLTDAGALGVQGEVFKHTIARMQGQVSALPTTPTDSCASSSVPTSTTPVDSTATSTGTFTAAADDDSGEDDNNDENTKGGDDDGNNGDEAEGDTDEENGNGQGDNEDDNDNENDGNGEQEENEGGQNDNEDQEQGSPTAVATSTGTVPCTPVVTTATATETGMVSPTAEATSPGIPTKVAVVTPQPGTPASTTFSFEEGGVNGWTGNEKVLGLRSDATQGKDGPHSLKVDLNVTEGGEPPAVFMQTDSGRLVPQEGRSLTAHIFAPQECADGLQAQWFVKDSKNLWYAKEMVALSAGSWQPLTYTVPAMDGQPLQLGIRLLAPSSCKSVYLDSMGQV